jgi:RNA polymerase sigma factor (sigma-70 family)
VVAADSFERFYELERLGVCRALTLALGDRAAAEEATQEAFVKAWLRWRRVSRMERPAGWVYVVAVRHALRARRSLDRSSGLAAPARDVAVGVSDVDVDQRLDVHALLDRLAPRQRLAVVLRYYADLPLDDIAGAMACSPGTVKSTLHTALERLRVETAAQEVDVDGPR